MRILITSGGTAEYIDDVRVLTNVSTGKLGAMVAREMVNSGHQVTYVGAKTATIPNLVPYPSYTDEPAGSLDYHPITDVASLMAVMEKEVPKHDVIIHAMAVSDFGFDRTVPIKVKSNNPFAFLDYMRTIIFQNPKVISHIKEWNPKCKLVGFKFEVGMSKLALSNVAYDSLIRNNCDLVIANDKEEMKREQEHIAYAIDSKKNSTRLAGKQAIAEHLVKYVDSLQKN